MKKTFLPIMLSLAILLSTFAVYPMGAGALDATAKEDGTWLLKRVSEYKDNFPDMNGVWCKDASVVMFETGLMLGRTDGTFGPYATLTIPHILAITARLHANLTNSDIDAVAASWLAENGPIQWPGTWYESYYAYLCSVLKVSNLGGYNPNANCSRASFAELLSAVLEVAGVELPAINTIPSSLPDVSEDFAENSYLSQAITAGTIKKSRYEAIISFYRAGVLTGFDKYGTFRSGSTLNRGQAAAMLARAVDPSLRESFNTARFDLCKDVLGLEHDAPAVTINGVDITANQFSYAFAVGRSIENALDFLAEQSAAVDLAVKEGYTPTDDEIAALRKKASERDGFAGLDADAWFYELSKTAAVEYVYKVFLERYGDDSNSRYTDGGNSYLTVYIGPGWASAEIQNHLDKLDVNAVSKRFAECPIGSTYVVSRPMLVGKVSTRLPV